MPTTRAKFPKRKVRLDCGKYLVRSVTPDDASERWASWMTDPEASAMLNAPAQVMKKSDIVAYIAGFDQRSRLLLGIFEKATGKLLGFLRIDIDHGSGRFLVSMLIGEPEYRNRGVTNDITVPFRDYFFETLGLTTMLATALSHNRPIIHYLLKSGWVLDQRLARHVKSQADGTMLDLCFFSLTRDAWRDWKKKNPDGAPTPAGGTASGGR
jgi:RimJ/RimL family protein N-acetyltransferase